MNRHLTFLKSKSDLGPIIIIIIIITGYCYFHYFFFISIMIIVTRERVLFLSNQVKGGQGVNPKTFPRRNQNRGGDMTVFFFFFFSFLNILWASLFQYE